MYRNREADPGEHQEKSLAHIGVVRYIEKVAN